MFHTPRTAANAASTGCAPRRAGEAGAQRGSGALGRGRAVRAAEEPDDGRAGAGHERVVGAGLARRRERVVDRRAQRAGGRLEVVDEQLGGSSPRASAASSAARRSASSAAPRGSAEPIGLAEDVGRRRARAARAARARRAAAAAASGRTSSPGAADEHRGRARAATGTSAPRRGASCASSGSSRRGRRRARRAAARRPRRPSRRPSRPRPGCAWRSSAAAAAPSQPVAARYAASASPARFGALDARADDLVASPPAAAGSSVSSSASESGCITETSSCRPSRARRRRGTGRG